MSDGDEPSVEDVMERMAQLEARFQKLAEDYNDLRYEINELDRKVERRT